MKKNKKIETFPVFPKRQTIYEAAAWAWVILTLTCNVNDIFKENKNYFKILQKQQKYEFEN